MGYLLAKHINNVKIWNNVRDGLPYPYTILDADKYIRMVQVLPYVQNFAIEIAGETVGGVGIAPLTDVERLSAREIELSTGRGLLEPGNHERGCCVAG